MATPQNPYAGKTVAELEAITRQGNLSGDEALQLAEAFRDAKNYAEDLANSVEDLSGKLQKILNISGKNAAIFNQMAINFNPVTGQANKLYTSISNITNASTIWMQLISMAVDRFKELDDAALSFRQNTGFLASQTSQVESNVRIASRDLARFGVTAESANEAAQSLANAFGDTAVANKENIEYVSLMKENLGISVEDSTALMQNFMGIGGMTSQVARETAGAAASLSKAAGVPFGAVMKEVAKPSSEVRSLIRGSVDALVKGAIEAKRLGTTLEAVGKAAAGMLDFQSSISDEMEASVLFGKDINLQKARELAYAGDLKGLAKEQSRLLQEAGDVSKMDYFQRIGIAKALGMSVEEMDKMNAKQKEMNELRLKSPELYKQLTAELDAVDKTNESVTEKYQKELKAQQLANVQKKLMNDMQQILVEISEALLPIVKLFFSILVPILKIGAAIIKFIFTPIRLINDLLDQWYNNSEKFRNVINSISSGFESLINSMDTGTGKVLGGIIGSLIIIGYVIKKQLIQNMMNYFKLFKSIPATIPTPTSSPTGLGTGGYGSTLPKPGGVTTSPIPATGPTPSPTAGQKIKEFLQNLAEGIKSFKPLGEILKGLIGIAASGPAFLLFIPAIPGLLLMAGVGALSPLITAGFSALSTGIKLMDITAIGKGLLGIAALGLSIIPFAFAMSLFSDVNWTGVMAGAAALAVFTAAAFGLGALLSSGVGAILFAAGVAGIAALGIAMLPFAFAAKLAGEGMKDFGIGVKDIASNINELASLKETLSVFKDTSIIFGIYAMGDAIGYLSSKLEGLGINLPALSEINNANNQKNSNAEIVGKLDELIELMRNGGIAVNIDGSKVSTAVGSATKFRGSYGSF